MLPIVQTPNEVLSRKAQPVPKIDASIKEFITQMTETLLHAKDPEGIGLAAPQVGKSLQIFIIRPSSNHQVAVFINPIMKIPEEERIMDRKQTRKKKKGVKLEGCLSLRDIWGVVHRYPKIVLSYQDETGAHFKKTFTGFLATIIQHEYDHLQGILFPKHVLEQGNILYKSILNEKGETIFEELKI